MKSGLLLAIIIAATGAHTAGAIDLLAVEKDATETVLTSLDQIEKLAKSTQDKFWQLVPPTNEPTRQPTAMAMPSRLNQYEVG